MNNELIQLINSSNIYGKDDKSIDIYAANQLTTNITHYIINCVNITRANNFRQQMIDQRNTSD